MSELSITKTLLEKLPKSILILRFRYYDTNTRSYWNQDWQRFIHNNKNRWYHIAGVTAFHGNHFFSDTQLIEFLNKTLETLKQRESKIAFSTQQIPYFKMDMRGLIPVSTVMNIIQKKSKPVKYSTVSSKSKVKK